MIREMNHGDIDLLLNIAPEIIRKYYRDRFRYPEEDVKAYINEHFSREIIADAVNNPSCKIYFVMEQNEIVSFFKLNFGKEYVNQYSTLSKLINYDGISDGIVELEFFGSRDNKKGQELKIIKSAIAVARKNGAAVVWMGIDEAAFWGDNEFKWLVCERKFNLTSVDKRVIQVGRTNRKDWVFAKVL